MYNFISNFLDLEKDVILVFCENAWEERRRIEMRRISRCFTRFPNCLVLGEPNIYHQSVWITMCGDFTWRLSDCEELVGEVNVIKTPKRVLVEL